MGIILYGCPGAGKGTFSQIYQERFPKTEHFSFGDWLRKEMSSGSCLGIRISEEKEKDSCVNNGYMLPDEFIFQIVSEKLTQLISSEQTFILDGFPRTLKQAKFLNKLLKGRAKGIQFVHIDIAQDFALKRIFDRLSCQKCSYIYNKVMFSEKEQDKCVHCGGILIQRDVDTEKIAVERVKAYFASSQEILHYYEKKRNLVRLNGSLTPTQVVDEFLNKRLVH